MWEGLRLLESSLQDLAKPGKVQDLAKRSKAKQDLAKRGTDE